MAENVPKFGGWDDDDDDVPYTEYFEVTRKKQGRRSENPSIPNDKLTSNVMPQSQAFPSRDKHKERTTGSHISSREGSRQGHLQKQNGLPSREEGKAQKPRADSPRQRRDKFNPSGTPRSGNQMNAGCEKSPVSSPLTSYTPSRAVNRGGQLSPSWERSIPSESANRSTPNTPGRSHLQVDTQRNQKHKKDLEIPKFGDWDINNPAAGEEYSLVFDKVRVEKQKVTGDVSAAVTKPKSLSGDAVGCKEGSDRVKISCFSWCRK